MSGAERSEFVYVTYIRTTVERLWKALTDPEETVTYWYHTRSAPEPKVGGAWSLVKKDGTLMDQGEVAEWLPPTRLVLKWRNEWKEEYKAEGYSRCEFDLAAQGEVVKLTVRHSMEVAESKLVGAVSGGWPQVLSNLKSWLETGEVILWRD
jgi:uncharacterized protein YndB with AHSA1/START domain